MVRQNKQLEERRWPRDNMDGQVKSMHRLTVHQMRQKRLLVGLKANQIVGAHQRSPICILNLGRKGWVHKPPCVFRLATNWCILSTNHLKKSILPIWKLDNQAITYQKGMTTSCLQRFNIFLFQCRAVQDSIPQNFFPCASICYLSQINVSFYIHMYSSYLRK